ncbi:hypothetical protein R5W24_004966 [Gemmata sp. JC717]|uniref:hypothetical protein n=1 Tax=Gemmata algarum TaxID=2975278 RepID=UPI0021BAB00D|nr:hypothetical protein [Gemmata algarum]MDY3555820.1 hypothetical protein [Gemmata algarum]
MAVRHMRLAIGLFFLMAGATLLTVRFVAPDRVAQLFDPLRLALGAILALVLAGVNFAKWYAGRLAHDELSTPVRRPFQPDPVRRGEDSEPNPDFDFGKPESGPARKSNNS